MKYSMKYALISIILMPLGLYGFGCKTLVGTRSQSLNGARELAGWQRHTNLPDCEKTYSVFAVIPTYEHSFKSDDIACFLLGGSCMDFSGSQRADREPTDILADYFGLPSDFCSKVCFDPKIVSFIMDFDSYIGFDSCVPGLYMQIHMPVVHSKWDLDLCECVYDPGMSFTSYPAGYLSDSDIELTALTEGENAPKNVQNAFRGKSTFGDMQEPLEFGKIFGRQSETRVSDLTFVLGYNIVITDWYHFGVNIRAAAPTGTLRKSEYLFEPIIGNDHHWELGAGLSGHVDFYCDEESDRKIGFYLTAQATHLFDSTQKRSYDLVNGNGSRYMLLQEITAPAIGLHVGLSPDDQAAANQYRGRLIPAINITTLDSTISVGVQGEVVAKLYYQHKGFEFDLGYNFWGKSAEKLKCRDCIPTCFAIKGDAQLYGFDATENAIALNATQSKATINGGQDIADDADAAGKGNFSAGNEWANLNADNPANASNGLGVALDNLTAGDAATFSATQQAVRTSNPAILLTNDDINECSALLPKAISHKLFAYIGYTHDHENVIPYIGVGGSAEWGCPCVQDNSAISQWSLWIKMGLRFS